MRNISGRAFAERFALNPASYAWLLGAGASATAGIPTGYQMIQEFRTKLFANESGISLREVDASDPVWQARVDQHHERQGKLPPKDDPSEYARAFEALYPTIEDRRLYIERQVSKGTPSLGHKVLGALLASRKSPCIFTTNFDSLVEDSATVAGQLLSPAERSKVTLAALDNAARAITCLRDNGWPLVVKLHGDYQSVELKNTDDELQSQDASLRLALTESLRRFGLIIAGYSGRDDSVMKALRDVLHEPHRYPGGIYWLCRDSNSLLPSVRDFLEQAELAQVDVYVVSGTTFDELAGDIADITELSAPLVDHIFGERKNAAPAQVPLIREPALRTPILRLTALPIEELPTVARRITLHSSPGITEIRARLKDANVLAVVAQAGSPKTLAVYGHDGRILDALVQFQPMLTGEITLNPLNDSWAKGVLYDALVRALCRKRPLRARMTGRGHSISISKPHADLSQEQVQARKTLLSKLRSAYQTELTGPVPGTQGTFSEGLDVRLERADERWWLVFEPSTFIDIPPALNEDDQVRARDAWRVAEEWRRERWVQKYNGKWSDIVDAWVELFTRSRGARHASYQLKPDEGINATFQFGPHSARSRPAHDHDYFHQGGGLQ